MTHESLFLTLHLIEDSTRRHLTKLHEIRSGPGKAGDFPNLTLTHLGSLQLGDLDGRAGISPQNLTCV